MSPDQVAKVFVAPEQALMDLRLEVALLRDSILTHAELMAMLEVYAEFGR